MTTHSHAFVAHCAYQIWEDSGRPFGRAEANWYEAERAIESGFSSAGKMAVEKPVTPRGESHSAHAMAESAAQQRKQARAPITAHTVSHKAKPPETGKPLWSQPHSS
jgi:hypothetical protein